MEPSLWCLITGDTHTLQQMTEWKSGSYALILRYCFPSRSVYSLSFQQSRPCIYSMCSVFNEPLQKNISPTTYYFFDYWNSSFLPWCHFDYIRIYPYPLKMFPVIYLYRFYTDHTHADILTIEIYYPYKISLYTPPPPLRSGAWHVKMGSSQLPPLFCSPACLSANPAVPLATRGELSLMPLLVELSCSDMAAVNWQMQLGGGELVVVSCHRELAMPNCLRPH